jgi:Mrp family chromosome partitioning ATPase
MTAIVIMLAELFSGRALRPVGNSTEARDRDETVEQEEQAVAAFVSEAGDIVQPSMLAVAADEEIAEEDEAEAVDADEPAVDELDDDDNEFSISSVADYLIDSRAPVAIAISPTGDAGSAATVLLARILADRGSRVVLVDMTGSGHPTDLMAEDRDAAGVTDLLCGVAAFGDTIHGDRNSDAHLIPQGTSDVRLAMRGAARLSLLLDALASAYDLVLVECGAADVAGVSRLTQSKDVEIILSLPKCDEDQFVSLMADFQRAGYERIVLMSGGEEHAERSLARHAA